MSRAGEDATGVNTEMGFKDQLRHLLDTARRGSAYLFGRLVRRPISKTLARRYVRRTRRPLCGPRVLVPFTGPMGIGDVVDATPLIQAIRIHWPRAAITLYRPPGDLLAGWCVVDRSAGHDDDLRPESFDHTFVPMTAEPPESGTVASLGKVHSWRRYYRRYFFRNQREYNLDLVRAVGYRGPTPPPYVSIKQPQRDLDGGSPTICLAAAGKPTHLWRFKRWPYYGELLGRVLEAYPEAVVWVLGLEADEFPENLSGHGRVFDLRGAFSLAEVAWVLRHADLTIGNDCGLINIADAVMAPCIELFGPTCELRAGPGWRGTVALSPTRCRPCQYSRHLLQCDHGTCIRALSVDSVMDVMRGMIAQLGDLPLRT